MGSCMRHLPFHAGGGRGLRVSHGRQQWQNTTVELERRNAEVLFSLDRATVSLCYNTARTMNTDEKIVQALEALQEGQKALQADVQKQGTHIEDLSMSNRSKENS